MNAPTPACALVPDATGRTPAPGEGPHGESGLVFRCGSDTLVGMLHPGRRDTGVLVIVGGPQVRVGSQRQFLLLARELSGAGFPVLRFDVRGMGDSTGAPRSFEHLGDDIAAALAALRRAQPQLQRVVLWGLCDGASAALLYLHDTADPQVAGLVLLNPWVRSEATLARTQVRHYYLDRLRQPDFWAKLLRGGVGAGALREFLGKLRAFRRPAPGAGPGAAPGTASPGTPAGQRRGQPSARTYTARMAQAWSAFPGSILLVLSGRDYTAAEFLEACASDPGWAGALQRRGLTRHDAPQADHTFSSAAERAGLFTATLRWLESLDSARPPRRA
jgi:exosortase A-associated hydrolase 1